MRVTVAATIARPVGEVFDFIADMRNDVQWAPLVSEVEQLQGEGPGEGARWRIMQRTGKRVGPLEIDMTTYQRPALLAWRMHPKQGSITSTMIFAKHAKGARIRQTNTYELNLSWLARVVLWFLAHRTLRRQMRNLRKVLEEGKNGSTPG